MPAPEAEFFHALAGYQGLALPAHRVAAAAEHFGGLAPGLAALRARHLAFLEDVVEPAAADRWIEQGGKSCPS